jgi:hypothetical protein
MHIQILLAAVIGLAASSAGAAVAPPATQEAVGHAPIPVRFALDSAGLVTLVIEDADGRRVRNLVSEAPFEAGAQVAWWDGLDDLGRDPNAAAHAVYHIPGKLVGPGKYQLRGLCRKGIDLRYEFTVYNPGNPPWRTKETSSEWLTNHTPPSAVCFIPGGAAPPRGDSKEPSPPQVIVGSFVAEGGSGVAWLDLAGRKLHGQMWIGGVWTGASYITRDAGDRPVHGVYAYTATAWEGDGYNKNVPELRLHQLVTGEKKLKAPGDKRFGFGEDPPVLTPNFKFPDKEHAAVGGLAARNGLVAASLTKMNQLLFVDAAAAKVLGTAALEDGRGLAFDAKGGLLAISGKRLLRLALPPADQIRQDTPLPQPQAVVAEGLEDPQQLALDDVGNIYISDRGASHQVKVFSADGKAVRTVGAGGAPKAGPYDPNHMNNPKGIAISGDGHLWVAEEDLQPKRVSLWTLDGKLVKAFYGPPIYGGGGVLDPKDNSLFYLGGMTFKLDWAKGASELVYIHHRPGPGDLPMPDGWSSSGPPETAIYTNWRKYLTDCFGCHPTNGAPIVLIWIERDHVAVPVAALGRPADWKILKEERFRSRLPQGADPQKPDWNNLLFTWTDLDGDAHMQPDEVAFAKGSVGSGITVSPDLSIVTGSAVRFAVQRFTAKGAPVYDLAKGEVLVPDPQQPTSSGGGQVLLCRDGWTVLTVAPKPFAPESLGGARKGRAMWSYPSVWPGLHASHIAAMPEFPGEVIGTTRLLGPAFTPRRGDAGEMWAINGNKGNVYLFTTDGLFVATLFRDCRYGEAAWSMPKAERGMLLSGVTNGEESFWPSITQTSDGNVYLVTNFPSILRLDGLETIRRLPARTLNVTPEMLAACRAWFVETEARRQEQQRKQDTLVVAIRPAAPTVDGKLDDWAGANWLTIDRRWKQQGDWGRSEQKAEAALAVAGDRLYAAYKTGEPNMLNNAGTSLPNLFKTGGALDLMVGTDPKADPKRARAATGDVRLLVAMVKGKPVAVLYRPVSPGGGGEGVHFSSPLRTITFDRVDDVTKDLVFAAGPGGEFEFAIPLAALGLKPEAGMVLRGDIGVLRGSEFRTTQRAYWTNKATGLTSDIPSEAELTPQLWGRFAFAAP